MNLPKNGVAKDIRHFAGSLLVFALVILILYYLTKYTIPEQNSQIVNTLIGMIAASIAMVISSITGQKPDELNHLKAAIDRKDSKIDLLVKEKDRLEGMIIEIQKQILENQDAMMDKVILRAALEHDDRFLAKQKLNDLKNGKN